MSWRMSGLRVTMPEPRGRKSRPTMFSRTDDLPEDWEPTTTYVMLVLVCAVVCKMLATHNLR